MPDEIDAIQAIKKFSGIHQTRLKYWLAYAGDGNGNVNTSQANYYLCRYPLASSPTFEIYNNRVSMIDNLRIIVGYTAYQPNLLQVLDWADQRVDTQDPNDNPIGPGDGTGYTNVPLHAVNHMYLGIDPVYVNWRQITPLGVFTSSGMTVKVWPGYIPRPGADIFVSTQTIDLTSHIPVSGARYSLISFNSVGGVVVTDGAINAGGYSALTFADIPDTPLGNWRSAAVALYVGQTAVVETRSEIDIIDLRFPEESPAINTENAPLTLVVNPHPGSVFDECTVRAIVGGKVYWSSHRAVSPDTALGYEYAYNILTGVNAEIASEAGKAAWKSVYNAADGLIYSCGQAYHDSITYRAAVWTTDPLTDTVTGTYLNDPGHTTGDMNELIAILDDGAQLVCGERGGTSTLSGGDYPLGGGLWTIPKATIGTPSTFTRVFEDTDATPHGGWPNLAKIGSTYFALLQYTATAQYKIKHSTNLTSWTTDIDGMALALNDITPSMCYHPAQNKVYVVVPNSSRQVVLYQSSGGAFTATTFANLVLPSSGTIDLDIAVFGGDLILMVSNQPGGSIATGTHDVYLISNLSTAPDFDMLYQNQSGATQHNNLCALGPDAYYPTAYLGGLNHVRLWSDNIGAAGVGDVVGPSSAVDGNLAAFDTTTGKLIKDSGVTAASLGSEVLMADGITPPDPLTSEDDTEWLYGA